MTTVHQISGNIVDVLNKTIYPGTIRVKDGKIVSISQTDEVYNQYILPGFVDAHVHIESSMLMPTEFGRLATPHGTVATISDPHEIANVLGVKGIEYMIENAKKSPVKFNFGAPPCVPATTFETAGATVTPDDIEYLFKTYPDIKYLSEVMNFPGVLFKDPDIMAKLALAKKYNKQIDGHAPGLRGEQAKQYIEAGITTDHECFTKEEALDKLKHGMNIIIREGSAAKNYDALISLLEDYTDKIMFCSDDKHPNDLVEGHINQLVKRAIDSGLDTMKVLQCACVNPVKHYKLAVGLLQEGDFADFIVVDDLKELNILATYINGELVAERGKTLLAYETDTLINNFDCQPIEPSAITVKVTSDNIQVIEALEGQLITNSLTKVAKKDALGNAISDVDHDVLKLVVVNRYQTAPPAIAFIKNFGLKKGAIASTVAHDSHNIIAVGVSDEDICKAINLLVEAEGGLSVAADDIAEVLSLPLAGIMTNENGYIVAQKYTEVDKISKQLGTPLYAPYMTLSFMALLVIPNLKLSDKGLFDGSKFQFTQVFV